MTLNEQLNELQANIDEATSTLAEAQAIIDSAIADYHAELDECACMTDVDTVLAMFAPGPIVARLRREQLSRRLGVTREGNVLRVTVWGKRC